MDLEKQHIENCIQKGVCHCGEPLSYADQHNGTNWEIVAHCPACYDGAPDSGNRNHYGRGKDQMAARQSWAETVDPWPDVAECCICEKPVTDGQIEGYTHYGYGDPICTECMDS